MFCSDCGQENDDDAKFCKNCGKPLGSNKTTQGKSKLKIIIPIAVIVVLIVIAGTMFMKNNNTVSSDAQNNNLDDTNNLENNTDSENNDDLTGYDNLLEILNVTEKIDDQDTGDGNYSAIITIEFSPNKNMDYVKYLSIDNLKMGYNDGSSLENQHVDRLRYQTSDISSSYVSGATTNPLNNGSSYKFEFNTLCESGKSINHIEGDIIAHTLTNGNITIGHINNEVTMT